MSPIRALNTEPYGSVFESRLDVSFAALSDATRRGVLEQLGRADASITDLAGKFHMTLTGMKKHVGVLEQAGLVTTEKVGRVRTCKLGPRDWPPRRHGSRGTPALGRTLRRVGQGRRGNKQKEKVDGRDRESDPATGKNPTTAERTSEREFVVTRTFKARRTSFSRRGPSPNCSSGGGRRSRLASPSSPARPMLARGASTVSCSATLPRTSHGVLRSVPRSDPALAPGLDE